jgi:hypothetical protein
MEGPRVNPRSTPATRAEAVIRSHRFVVPRTRELPQATARPTSAAWAQTRSANPAKSAA